jgi:two-component system chemotaxis response regulator CheY
MVLDDSEVVRRVLKVYLVLSQVDWIEAPDAQRALQLLRLVPVDLVLADVHMPDLDGLEFVRRLRTSEREAVRRLPVILLSADERPDLEARALAAGADGFLRKPVSSEALMAAVQRVLGRSQGGGAW